MTALNTMTTIMKAMNAAEAKNCLDELLGVYNEAVDTSRKMKLVLDRDGETTTSAPNYRRRGGGRAKIWCKVVSSVPSSATTMKDVDGDAVWSPYDFSDKAAGAVVAGGRSRSAERFIGIVKPGAKSEFCDVDMTGVEVVLVTENGKSFLQELAART